MIALSGMSLVRDLRSDKSPSGSKWTANETRPVSPWEIALYFLLSFATLVFPAAGCGRRKVDATTLGFFSAFGFFSSRPLAPRPFDIRFLLSSLWVYGACLSALFDRRRHD
jgi:hypothetical protein